MAVELRGVTKVVGGATHLYDISVALEPGSFNVLLGPTQAGKTSIMRIMGGLDRPTSGRIFVDGADRTGASVRRRDVAMVYQQFINYPAFTVFENIAAPLRRKGVASAEIDRRVRETAATLHIEHLLDRLPAQLSGGQQQRTALARALVKQADLLLLDEPLVNLDYKLREELRAELRELFARRTATVVYATTEPQEALMMGGSTIVVDAGRVLQVGPTVDVYRNPATVRVAQVCSDPPVNLVPGAIRDGTVVLGNDIRMPLTAHLTHLPVGDYTFGVRAHHVSVAPREDGCVSMTADVELGEISGSETFIHVRHGDVPLVSQEQGVHTFKLGERIAVFINPARLYAFDGDDRLVASPHGDPGQEAA